MSNRKNTGIKTIGLVLRLSYASGRDLLHGISSYAHANCHWRLKLLSQENLQDIETGSTPKHLDGIITSEPLSPEFLHRHVKVPLVVIGARDKWLGRRTKDIAFVRNDDRDIGHQAAEFLLGLGTFNTFAFVPTNIPYYCSILRHEGFAAKLASKRLPVVIYEGQNCADGSKEDISAIEKWLKALPKPIALLAVHDLRATQVLEAATNLGLKTPGDLSLIGVDNDELLCDFTNPQLTSIFPDHVYEGELAAQTMMSLLDKPKSNHPRTVKSTRKSIVERESTKPIAPSVKLANTAMEYIRNNALKGISANDVIKHLGVSRSLANLRFRKHFGQSILDTILDIRLTAVKHKLTTTRIPIGKIAAACGFENEAHSKHLFKKRFGISMRDYRSEAKQQGGTFLATISLTENERVGTDLSDRRQKKT